MCKPFTLQRKIFAGDASSLGKFQKHFRKTMNLWTREIYSSGLLYRNNAAFETWIPAETRFGWCCSLGWHGSPSKVFQAGWLLAGREIRQGEEGQRGRDHDKLHVRGKNSEATHHPHPGAHRGSAPGTPRETGEWGRAFNHSTGLGRDRWDINF